MYTVLKLFQRFEGNHEANVAPSENEFHTRGLGCNLNIRNFKRNSRNANIQLSLGCTRQTPGACIRLKLLQETEMGNLNPVKQLSWSLDVSTLSSQDTEWFLEVSRHLS